MSQNERHLTGVERRFSEDELIVSKTDAHGNITYANDVFMRVSGYSEAEAIGKPHSIVRHPHMPRCLFHFMWQRIQSGNEIFVYLNNRAKTGDYYWVLAHVTPNLDSSGKLVGFHSNRRVPRREAIQRIEPLYARLRAQEERHENRKVGIEASNRMLNEFLTTEGVNYDRFVLGL